MEDLNQPLDTGLQAGGSDQRLQFTAPVRGYLLETAKWAMFFAVLLFILLGIMALGGLISLFAGGAAEKIAAVLLIGIYCLIIYFPAWYYYKFSTLTRQALSSDDNPSLDEGFAYLRRFYRFVGILIIVVLCIYVLALVVGISMLGNFTRGN